MWAKRESVKKWLAAVSVTLLAACASNPEMNRPGLSKQQLLSGTALFGAEAESWLLPEHDILAVSDAMQKFLQQHAEYHGNKAHRLRVLLRAMQQNGLMDLHYSVDKTLTAQQTFDLKNGNCLSFTNLFVALARQVGLEAIFQYVDVPPNWRLGSDFVSLDQHINVVVKNPYDPDYMVDFNLPDYRGNYDSELIEDHSAFSMYYSNIGVEHLKQREFQQAFLYLKKALQLDGRRPENWINLGALYSENGLYDFAESAYLYALKNSPHNQVANNSLATLYQYTGNHQKAEYFAEKARFYRNKNPYYHFWLAQTAHQSKNYSLSNTYLEKAIAKKNDEHIFYFLMGVNYFHLGDNALAGTHFSQAIKQAKLARTQQRYREKIDRLRAENERAQSAHSR